MAYEQAQKRRDFANDSTLLDVGCGWGRLTATAMRDFAASRITSVDVQTEAVEFCRKAGFANVVKSEPNKPMPLPNDAFDMAIAYSVFSHLSEDAHWSLLNDIRRVLKPGGVAVVTTRAKSVFAWLNDSRARGSKNLAFMDTEEAARRYDAGEFMFDAPHAGTELAGFYGEAAISPKYVARRWSTIFREVFFLEPDQANQEQAAIVAVK
jgi:ubiquinone/menaquinone biosynthesis C-methylase UbiE